MPAVFLQRFDDQKNLARFYEVDVCRTLLGDWAVVYRWGRIGTHGRTQQDWFSSAVEADEAHLERVKQKKKRGYSEVCNCPYDEPDPAD